MVDHAARDGNQGFGVLPSYLMDGLPTFLVARIGNGAGVDDENICCIVTFSNLIARRLEPRSQSIGLIEVDAATEGFEGDFLAHFRVFIL